MYKRQLSHLGVFEVLEREKIPVAAIIGTSMGSIMGGLYASGRTPEDMREVLSKVDLMEIMSGRNRSDLINGYNKPAVPGDSLFSFTIDKNKNEQGRLGALNAKDLYAFLSDLTSHVSVTDFDHLPIPFAAVATNLGNGDTVIPVSYTHLVRSASKDSCVALLPNIISAGSPGAKYMIVKTRKVAPINTGIAIKIRFSIYLYKTITPVTQ